MNAIKSTPLVGLLLIAGVLPASAQQDLGAVVCVGSETETLASSGPVRRVILKDTEVVYRVGVRLADQEEVEAGLLAELSDPEEAGCVRSDPEHSHVVVVSYMGVVRQDLTIDPEDPRYQAFAVGYGTNWEEAEQYATRLDRRFGTIHDGGEYEVLVQERWGVADAAGREEAGPAAETPQPARESVESGLSAEGRRPGTVFRDCAACPEMVVVPAGSFLMGSRSTEAGRYDDEGPQHTVTIRSPFAVGVYEVAFAEWDACVSAGWCGRYRPGDEGWGRGRRPAINVSWEDAQGYVQWLSRETGEEYRLLSEAEWEYVARAGTSTAMYWGGSESGQCRYGNGADAAALRENPWWTTASCSDGYASTAPAGSFQPNNFGLYDVLGNVWEWTEDCWNENYSGAPRDGSAWRSGDCSLRVLRGGSWGYGPRYLRSANRGWLSAGIRSSYDGFRVARTIN